jgi:hypothetical protein
VPTVPAKQLIKDLPPVFESKDVKARDKVKEIMVRNQLANRSVGARALGVGVALQPCQQR